MSNVSNVSFRIDAEVKNKADALFSQLGMNMTTAFNIFLRQAIRTGGIPFDVNIHCLPNQETIEAMLEARRIANDPCVKSYPVEEALEELKK